MTCNYCNSDNFKYLTSSTNSTYTYCRDCNTNFDIAYKNVFSKKDIYYIENVIFELVQDFYDFDLSKVDIIVCE